jgi:hypothetical protein
MKKALSIICIAVLIAFSFSCVTTTGPKTNQNAAAAGNVVKNGAFDQDDAAAANSIKGVAGTANWMFSLNGGGAGGNATCVSEGGALHIGNISDVGSATYAIQIIQTPILVEKGYEYTVQFDAKATAARTVDVKIGGTQDRGWADYTKGSGVGTVVDLDTTMKTHEFKFIMGDKTDDAARFEFQLGMNKADVWIDNVKLLKGDKVK